MKSFYEFYQKLQELGMQPQLTPTQGQGASPPIPPPDPNLAAGMTALSQIKDPRIAQAFQQFTNQLKGAGILKTQQSPQNTNPGQQQPNQGQMQQQNQQQNQQTQPQNPAQPQI